MPTSSTRSYQTTAAQIAEYAAQGFTVIRGLLDAVSLERWRQAIDEVAELRELSERLEPSAEACDVDLTVERDGHFQRCINTVFNRDPIFLKYLDKPGMIELAEAIHGADCHIVSIHTWAVGPGRPDQHLHADWLPVELPEELRNAAGCSIRQRLRHHSNLCH